MLSKKKSDAMKKNTAPWEIFFGAVGKNIQYSGKNSEMLGKYCGNALENVIYWSGQNCEIKFFK